MTAARASGATEQIAQGRFDARVPGARGDELGRLGLAINRMAERLSGFVTGQKRFLGDTAHELCSPIARMQVALGILEQRAGENQRACLADLRPGDTLVIWKIDRLGRNLRDLIDIVTTLEQCGVGVRSLTNGHLDTTTAQGKLASACSPSWPSTKRR